MIQLIAPLLPGLVKAGASALAQKSEKKQSRELTLLLFDIALIILQTLSKQTDNQVDDEIVLQIAKLRRTLK